jgi:hypothetical protein
MGDYFSRSSIRRARKPYVCAECANQIPVGVSYCYMVWKDEFDEVAVARLCTTCNDDWDSVMKLGVADEMNFGEIAEDVEDAIRLGVIDLEHPLVVKYCPELIEEIKKTEGAKKAKEEIRETFTGDPVIVPYRQPVTNPSRSPPDPRRPA